MHLDIDFNVQNIKYARMYQSKNDYAFEVVRKDYNRIVIGKPTEDGTTAYTERH